MPQSSYEVWYKTVHFQNPDRMPVYCPAIGVSDTVGAGRAAFDSEWARTGQGLDHWGILWRKSDLDNLGQIARHPLADWSAYDSYRWPDPDRDELYAHIPAKLDEAEDKYVQTSIWMLLFERMWALRGYDNVLVDLVVNPEIAAELADKAVDFAVRVIRNTAAVSNGRIHALGTTDDWGTQHGATISPEMFREFFLPRYKTIFDACHEVGWDVFLHSCGKVNELVPLLIEAGADMLNLQQPRLLGIEEMGRRFRGKVCFCSPCDIQATLPHRGVEAIREEARMLVEHWATPEGGFIFNDYPDLNSIGSSVEKSRAMYEAFMEFDPYRGGETVIR